MREEERSHDDGDEQRDGNDERPFPEGPRSASEMPTRDGDLGLEIGFRAHRVKPYRWAASQLLHEAIDALVGSGERVFAEHRALRLIVDLQVDPVDGVIATPLLGPFDEFST
jgi:hypothetical protein